MIRQLLFEYGQDYKLLTSSQVRKSIEGAK